MLSNSWNHALNIADFDTKPAIISNLDTLMLKLFYRQKVLLALIQHFEGVLTSTDFQKHLFLYSRLCENKKSYDFVPYRFGCYSFQAVQDKRKLIEIGYLEDTSSWKLTRTGNNYVSELSRNDDKKMALYVERYGELKGKNLVRHIYKNYPFYAIYSEILDKTLSGRDLEKVIKLRPKFFNETLFATIGYEGLSIEAYLTKLIVNDVRMLIDVRKNPFSRKYGFSKTVLSKLLSDFSIKYKHLPELGIESNDRQSLNRRKRSVLGGPALIIFHFFIIELADCLESLLTSGDKKNRCGGLVTRQVLRYHFAHGDACAGC